MFKPDAENEQNKNIDIGKYFSLEDRYKMLIDQAPIYITHFDLDLKIIYVNQYGLKFLGKKLEEIAGHSIMTYMGDEAIQPFMDVLSKIGPDLHCVELENEIVDIDGEVYLFNWLDQGIFDSAGRLIGYQSIGQDVTQKKEIEIDLKHSQARLMEAQIIGCMGHWELDMATNITLWSDQTFRLLGFYPGEVKPDQELYREHILSGFVEKFINNYKYNISNQIPNFKMEYPFLRKDGVVMWLKDQGRIEYDSQGKAIRMYGTILDITDQKELQLSLENHLKSEAMVLKVSTLFMKTNPENLGDAIFKAVEIIGKFFRGDRAYLLLDNKCQIYDSTVYEWILDEGAYGHGRWGGDEKTTPRLINEIDDNDVVLLSDIYELPHDWRKDRIFFKKSGIGAIYAASLIYNNRICGYLCIDSRTTRQDWNKDDCDLLKIVGEMCVSALESKYSRDALEREKEFLSVTLMSIGDGFISLNSRGMIELINKNATALLGLENINYRGLSLEEIALIYDKKSQKVLGFQELTENINIAEKGRREAVYQRPDKTKRILSYSCTPIPGISNSGPGCALIFSDVTEEVEKQDEIRFLSFHDSLTKLYNRAFMEAELERLDTVRQLPLSIIIGDVNGLKMANDVFGHPEGDRLLKSIAGILHECCRDEDVIARCGGDEFSIILPKTSQKIADRICDRIRILCEKKTDTSITPSIALGSATKLQKEEPIDVVLREAENRMYRRKLLDDRSVRSAILSSLKKTMFEKSFETEAHTQRMVILSTRFGKALGLTSNLQSDLNLLAIMHDMGKIAVPSTILGKIGPLDDDEWIEIKKHPETGYRISQSSQELSSISDYILCHHERWDGKGYPRGIKQLEIPELSRIISIIDTYDVMTNGRTYRKGVSSARALEEIEACAGTQFDPGLAKDFIYMMQSDPADL